MTFSDILIHVQKQFGVKVECEVFKDTMFLKVNGFDSASLCKYINDSFENLIVTTTCNNKYYNNNWIKIEKCG